MATNEAENQSPWAMTGSRFLNTNPDLTSHNYSHSNNNIINNNPNNSISDRTTTTDQSSDEKRVIRKRGRPRKYNAMTITTTPTDGDDQNKQQVTRSRGRPKGSRNKNKHHSSSSSSSSSAIYDHIPNFQTFKDFTPHVMTVKIGEDVVSKLMELPMSPRSVTIISARGAIVYVTVRHHSSGLPHNFQGVHKILFMSLSCLNEISLEVGLTDPNGKFIVGVASLLIAGTPVEIVLGSFIQNSGNKQESKSKFSLDSSMAATTHALGTSLLLNNSNVNNDQEPYMPLPPASTPAPIIATPISNGPNINSFMF